MGICVHSDVSHVVKWESSSLCILPYRFVVCSCPDIFKGGDW